MEILAYVLEPHGVSFHLNTWRFLTGSVATLGSGLWGVGGVDKKLLAAVRELQGQPQTAAFYVATENVNEGMLATVEGEPYLFDQSLNLATRIRGYESEAVIASILTACGREYPSSSMTSCSRPPCT